MELIISSVTTMIVNLVVFSLLPIIWWFFRHRKEEKFFKWIGFFKPQVSYINLYIYRDGSIIIRVVK